MIECPNGPECADPAVVAAGCKPLNIFGPNAATPQATQYFHYNPVTDITNTQTVAGAQLSGKLFDLPAGPLSFSSGLEYRRETQKVTQDPLGAQEGAFFFTYGPSSEAAFNVKEGFVEALVPILNDKPFAKVLQFEAADRVSDYDTIGRTNAWKLGAQWAPSDDFRFRIMRASSVRAPNLTELYSPGTTSAGYYDPCSALYVNLGSSTRAANCAKLGIPANYVDSLAEEARLINNVGNPNLSPETARSWTVGGVLTPRQLPGLRLSVDWWSTDIDGAINALPVQTIINGCVDAASISNTLCPLVVRGNSVYGGGTSDPHAITVVHVSPLNIGVLRTEGSTFRVCIRPRGTRSGFILHRASRYRLTVPITLRTIPL